MLGDLAIKKLGENMKYVPNINSLNLSNSRKYLVYLGKNDIREAGALILIENLKYVKKLMDLDLSK